MVKIIKLQATARIGPALDNEGRTVHKERKFGELFELDVSIPFNKAYYTRLFSHGAVKIMPDSEDASFNSIPPERSEPELTAPPFSKEEAVSGYTEPPESIEAETPIPVAEEESPNTDHLSVGISVIDWLTKDQVKMLGRIGVKTIGDIDDRTDAQLKMVRGIGHKRIAQLREIYKSGIIKSDEG